MKFKMAPNSLFAVLLRSPWWISIALALVFVGAAKAWMPADLWVFGAIGALPLFAIGCISLYQQLKAPSASQVEASTQALGSMPWADFSKQLEQAYTQAGYTVERLQGAGAGPGADFALTQGARTTLVAAKRWKAAAHGVEGLQALHAARQARDASACVYVALGTLSDKAWAFAKAQGVQVVQAQELARLVKTR